MKSELILFTADQGNLLIRLFLAHILSDFVFQPKWMVETKKWFSKSMILHIVVVFLSTLLLTGLWNLALIISVAHWFTDSAKVQFQNYKKQKPGILFLADQLLQVLLIIGVWFWHFQLLSVLFEAVKFPFANYTLSLILLAYIWVVYPVGYIIKFVTQSIVHQNIEPNPVNEKNLQHGGKLIGQFERIIILTLVLLSQYEAIGFLITGKSIIRFADHNSNLRSEYVLVGTLMSYAIAILTGVLVNNLLAIS